MRKLHGVLGGVCDPHAAYMLLRGLKTLSLRVEQQNKNAQAMAEVLDWIGFGLHCIGLLDYMILY